MACRRLLSEKKNLPGDELEALGGVTYRSRTPCGTARRTVPAGAGDVPSKLIPSAGLPCGPVRIALLQFVHGKIGSHFLPTELGGDGSHVAEAMRSAGGRREGFQPEPEIHAARHPCPLGPEGLSGRTTHFSRKKGFRFLTGQLSTFPRFCQESLANKGPMPGI